VARAELYRQIRDELYHAKTLVRSVRNATQVKAAALQDSEERIDVLLEELEALPPIPTPEGGPGTNGKAEQHPTHAGP
jgi:hypothetical protein